MKSGQWQWWPRVAFAWETESGIVDVDVLVLFFLGRGTILARTIPSIQQMQSGASARRSQHSQVPLSQSFMRRNWPTWWRMDITVC